MFLFVRIVFLCPLPYASDYGVLSQFGRQNIPGE